MKVNEDENLFRETSSIDSEVYERIWVRTRTIEFERWWIMSE